MRHRKTGRKLGRNSSHRKAMFRNMMTSLFQHGSIKTTEARAKELRRFAERLVTLGKRGTLHHKRIAAKTIQDRAVLAKLFDEIAPGFKDRHGGYTRIIRLGRRRGDAALMTVIELLPPGAPVKKTRRAPVAPKVTSTASIPATKERFDASADDADSATDVTAEEAVAEAAPAAEEAAEEAPAAEETAEEAPAAEEDERASEGEEG